MVKIKDIVGLFKKSIDYRSFDSLASWAWGGGPSSSGIVVNPQTAMQCATVYACCQVLAQSIGMLPITLFTGRLGSLSTADDHPLTRLLCDEPNDYQTPVELMEMLTMSLCLRGNAYCYVARTVRGEIAELIPINPDMITAEMADGNQMVYTLVMSNGSKNQLTSFEIMHIRGLTLNGWLGISPIAYARESIGLALATEKFGSQLFRNGAKMSGVLEHPAKMSKDAYNRLRDSFDAATSGENSHRTALLEEGTHYSKISMSADDAQFLATRQYQRNDIASIYRIPPHMIGDLSRATFSNIEHSSLEYVTYTLMPWLNRFEKSFGKFLLSPEERKTTKIKFDISALLRGDAAARSAYYTGAIQSGWLVGNEVRRMESELGVVLNDLDGLDTPMVPLNMAPPAQAPQKNRIGN